jgi:hypothetical protein
MSQIQRIKKRVIFHYRFRRFSTNQADLRNLKRQRHRGFDYYGDEIGLIFVKKICAAASAFFGDTPVSPSLLVKHAPSRVLILLHAIYKHKKPPKWWLFVFVVGHTTPKSGKRYHFLMVSERLYFKVFNHVDAFLRPYRTPKL